jgi:hypothetical protein
MNHRTRIRQTSRHVNDVEIGYSNTDNIESHSEECEVAIRSSRDDLGKLGNAVSVIDRLYGGYENVWSPSWLVSLVKLDRTQYIWIPSELEIETVHN